MLSWDKISRKDEKRRKNKADALCAFRTITTMLSSIQSIRDTTDNVSNAKSDDKPALTVLDAFAALTIRNHGIVALTSMPYDRSTSFQVLASAYLKGEVLNSAQLPATVHQVKKFWLRNLFMAQNPRDASVKLTTVVDPEIKVPQHLKDAVSGGSELLTSFLTHEWSTLQDKIEESFEIHIWMISRFIEKSGSDTRSLSCYVIATCYERMLTRMNYRTSQSFRRTLQNLPPFEFSNEYPESMRKDTNDHRFITQLAEIGSHLKTPIAKLMQHPDNLYNEETYMDFHALLCELLQLLFDALVELRDLQTTMQGILSGPNVESIRNKLSFIASIGTVLRLMVKGSAIKKHLYAIATFLPIRPSGIELKEDENENDEWIELNCDSKLSVRKWKACLQWLNLMVVYFDAILVLSQFVKNEGSVDIDVEVLLQPTPPREMLPWKTLLRHKQFFPTSPSSPSVDEIIRFLEPIPTHLGKTNPGKKDEDSSEAVVALLRKLDVQSDVATFARSFDRAIDLMTKSEYMTPGSAPYARTIVEKLESFKDMLVYQLPDDEEITTIIGMIVTLADNVRLEKMLQKGSALDTGLGFTGSCHCEVCVASYCIFMKTGWVRSGARHAVGVSKRCCPICAYLLKLLDPTFTFTNTHSTIFACSLPDYLPMDIIAKMISKFGHQLREELVDLMKRTEILRSCNRSIGSKNFSTDGFGSLVDLNAHTSK